jgi:hypothetical protein
MNALELVNEVLSRFALTAVDSSNFATDADAIIALRKINLAVQQMATSHHFKWCRAATPGQITAVEGTSTYQLAAGVARVIVAKQTFEPGGVIKVITREALETIAPDRTDSNSYGTPKYICPVALEDQGDGTVKWKYELYPIPDSRFAGETVYYYYDNLISDMTTYDNRPIIPSHFHWVIVELAETLMRRGPVRSGDQNQVDLFTYALKQYQLGYRNMILQDADDHDAGAIWESSERTSEI